MTSLFKIDVHILAEATRILVADRLAIAESFENGISCEQLVLHRLYFLGTKRSQELYTILCRLGLTRSTLA